MQLCRAPLKNKKARWPFGHRADVRLENGEADIPRETSLALEGFAPIQCIGPPPWIFWLVEPIARPDKIVGGDEVVGGVGNDAAPTPATCPAFRRPHQPQLQGMAAVTSDHADPAEITRVVGTRRWNHPGKSDRQFVTICEPPMSQPEFRNRRAFKERQAVKVGERVWACSTLLRQRLRC